MNKDRLMEEIKGIKEELTNVKLPEAKDLRDLGAIQGAHEAIDRIVAAMEAIEQEEVRQPGITYVE